MGLKLSRRANAVSALHGQVSRAMWTGLYPGKSEDAVPIGHITNGVHVPMWLAPQMHRLYVRHLGTGWHEHSSEARLWQGIESVDDGELWETHLNLKGRLLEFVRRRAVNQAERRGESPEMLKAFGSVSSQDALTIGFARRFATYKRANLILADIERLTSIVNDPERPVQFVFAGKAHPRDEPGKRVLQQIAELMRDPRFAGKFVFIEDYDINVGAISFEAWTCGSTIPDARWKPRGPAGKGSSQRRSESFRAGWLVGGSLRRPQRFCHRQRKDAFKHGRSRYARRRRPLSHAFQRSDSPLLPARS